MGEMLHFADFEIIPEPTPENETPRYYLFRMTGRDFPELEDISWEQARDIGMTNIFTDIIIRLYTPKIVLRRKEQ